jgi:SEFIR domain-containing protein
MTAEHRPPRVFISYAHDSEPHKRQVHDLARFLRAEGGIDVRLDLWDAGMRRDWSTWMLEQFRNADFVVVVASLAYKRRAEGGAEAADGRGVQFEAALLRDLITEDRRTWIPKVLPVVLPGRSVAEIPAFLQPYSASRYVVDAVTMDGVDELYRVLTGQPLHRAPELGRLVVRPAADDRATWHVGQEIRLGSESFSIVALEREDPAPDQSWVAHRAVARRSASVRLVVLRQVRTLRAGEPAERRRTALAAEAALLAELAETPGFPRLVARLADRDVITVATSRPDGPSMRDLYGPPRGSPYSGWRLEPARTTGFLQTVCRLCQPLQALHRRGLSHRRLTPDSIVLTDGGRRPALRDVGLATVEPASGEGSPPYQAPEQRHLDHALPPGERTDVFQLASIVHATLTTTEDPHIPPPLAELLAAARSPTPDDRPRDASTFGAELHKAMSHLPT